MKLAIKDMFKKQAEPSKREATEDEILRSEAGAYEAGKKTGEEEK